MTDRYRNFTATIHGDDRRAILDRWRETVDWFVGRETTVMKVMDLKTGKRLVTTNAGQEYEEVSGDDGVSVVLHGKVPTFRNSSQISPTTSSSSISGISPLRPTLQPSPVSVTLIPRRPSPPTTPRRTSPWTPSRTSPSTPSRTRFVGGNATEAREGERGGVAAVTPVRGGRQLVEATVRTGTYDAAMRMVEDNDPVWYIGGQKVLSNYFESKFQNVDHSYADRSAYGREYVTDFRTVRVLIGRTGLGKTEYALAHFRQPLHVRDDEDWRRLTRRTDGIVLDDLDFRKWSPAT
ncbi:hypothetical protein Trydic_g10193 [Trypoxylus dichotomus]